MTESISPEDFVVMVRKRTDEMDDVKLFYVLKMYGLKLRIGSQTFKLMKTIIALDNIGVKEFGASMVASVADLKCAETCWSSLHILGDNHIIIKLRGVDIIKGVWKVSPLFMDSWNGDSGLDGEVNGIQS